MSTTVAPHSRWRHSAARLCCLLWSKLSLTLLLTCSPTYASVGLDTIEPAGGAGPITVFYPSDALISEVRRGSFVLNVAWKGRPVAGNQRLIMISHGSGGSPWPQSDLARTLVEAGFTVALPEHAGDNWHDMRKVGPDSWTLRPAEVSNAINAVAADPRFAALIASCRVFMSTQRARLAPPAWSSPIWPKVATAPCCHRCRPICRKRNAGCLRTRPILTMPSCLSSIAQSPTSSHRICCHEPDTVDAS